MPDTEKKAREKAEFEAARRRLKECDEKSSYVFVSYKRSDWRIVYPIVEKLQEKGCNVWIDKELNKKAGKNWQDIAFHAMAAPECMKVLFFISEQSMTSVAVCAELLWSVGNYIEGSHGGEVLEMVPINIDGSGRLEEVQMGRWVHELARKYYHEALRDEDRLLLKDVIKEEDRVDNLGRLPLKIFEKRFENKSQITFLNKEDIQGIFDNLSKKPESNSKQSEPKKPESNSEQSEPKKPEPVAEPKESMMPIKAFTEKFVKAMERNKADYQKENPGSKTPPIVFREIVLQMPWQSEKEQITGQNWKPVFTAMLDSFYEFKGDAFFRESVSEAVKKRSAEPYVADLRFYKEKIADNVKICKHYQKLTNADYYIRNWYGADVLLGEMIKWIDRFNRFLKANDPSCSFHTDDYLMKFEVDPEFEEYFK